MDELSAAERRLLGALPRDGTLALEEAARAAGFRTPGEALRAADGPARHGLVVIHERTHRSHALNEEGLRYQEEGLPERRAVQAMDAAGGRLPMGRLAQVLPGPEVKLAIGWLKRKGWADMQDGDQGKELVLRQGVPAPGPDEELLGRMTGEPRAVEGRIDELEGRGIVTTVERIERAIGLTDAGRDAAQDLEAAPQVDEVTQVTPALVARWADMDDEEKAGVLLRRFELGVPVAPLHAAKPHPLTQMMDDIRRVFLGMGFEEIAGDYVESAYWNMDALFIPQDHPAREEQDTFYLEHPARLDVQDADLERGRHVHQDGGGTGSTGWGGDWSADVARQALLRTHTTNTTVRHLAEHPEGPHKVFGLGRVFRNETMDSTHLPEFHQIEGIVTEPGASFDMLVGLCKAFFGAMGFPEVRFRPAYFPYTEPSMEIDVHYQGKWMELGGCGLFRPEVTEPLGVRHPVLAWGFGLERLAMMRLGLKDIRQLYLSDVQWLHETPLQ